MEREVSASLCLDACDGAGRQVGFVRLVSDWATQSGSAGPGCVRQRIVVISARSLAGRADRCMGVSQAVRPPGRTVRPRAMATRRPTQAEDARSCSSGIRRISYRHISFTPAQGARALQAAAERERGGADCDPLVDPREGPQASRRGDGGRATGRAL